MKVGPQSAGANPGPACYARGGAEPTVTDADLVLGWLNADFFLGGRMPLKLDAARASRRNAHRQAVGARSRHSGGRYRQDRQFADGRSAALGHGGARRRPAGYAMVAFGGCGPVHAAKLAEAAIARVIVPAAPGVASAMGLLVSDLKRDYLRTRRRGFEEVSAEEVKRNSRNSKNWRSKSWRRKIFRRANPFRARLDLRYTIQKYELAVPVAGGTLEREKSHGAVYSTSATSNSTAPAPPIKKLKSSTII